MTDRRRGEYEPVHWLVKLTVDRILARTRKNVENHDELSAGANPFAICRLFGITPDRESEQFKDDFNR